MNPRPRYRMYIDEAGNSYVGRNDQPSNRYLSLTGVIIELAQVSAIQREMDALKIKHFDSANVVLHRNEIEIHRGVFNALSDSQLMQAFGQELESLLRAWPCTVITACIDKPSYYQRHSSKTPEPFHLCI